MCVFGATSRIWVRKQRPVPAASLKRAISGVIGEGESNSAVFVCEKEDSAKVRIV